MIQAITIDFWNTVVDSRNGQARRDVRMDAVRAVYRHSGRTWNQEEVDEALRVSYATFEKHWRGEQRTLSASECLEVMWKHLSFDVPERLHAQTVRSFEDSILAGLPGLLPGAAEALEKLAGRYRLALISDTAFSPGRVLREVLTAHGVDQYFSYLAFSDEVGVSKPHPRIFDAALRALDADAADSVHVGDIERTDIAGARARGMRSILFRGDESGRYHHENTAENTDADAVAHSWTEILAHIETFDSDHPGTRT
jgi:putative hydrolase of the HAD superfamily